MSNALTFSHKPCPSKFIESGAKIHVNLQGRGEGETFGEGVLLGL